MPLLGGEGPGDEAIAYPRSDVDTSSSKQLPSPSSMLSFHYKVCFCGIQMISISSAMCLQTVPEHPQVVTGVSTCGISAYQTCFTLGASNFSFPISGFTARAYKAMANGSPCVLPSEEVISPSPMKIHTSYRSSICINENLVEGWTG